MTDLTIEQFCFIFGPCDPGPHLGTKREKPLQLSAAAARTLHGDAPQAIKNAAVLRRRLADYGDTRQSNFRRIVDVLWNYKGSPKRFDHHPWSDRMLDAACRYNYLGVAGCASSGKCLSPDTEVLMFDGSVKRAADVAVGDRLMGDDSTPRNVLGTNIGRSNMVRIVPGIGSPWECNDDHILTLKRTWAGWKARKRVGEVLDISVKDYLAKSPTWRRSKKLFCVGAEFSETPVDFDPWMYGLWLGDGHTGRPMITSSDREVEVNARMDAFAKEHGYIMSRLQYKAEECPTYSFKPEGGSKHGGNAFLNLCRESCAMAVGETSRDREKRILKRYLINSRAVRLQVLAGLIDSDGYAAGTYFEIACSLKGLTDDIAFLARSLGFRVSVTPRITKCNGKDCPNFRINIMGAVQEIPTARKKCKEKTLRTKSECTNFAVEQLGEGDWAGFTLDGNGRFLLSDFTVTHNSDFFAMWGIVNFICAPFHTLVAVVSTSLGEARRRIWGSCRAYWQARPGLPGKLVDSLGMIRFWDGTDLPSSQGSDKQAIHLVAGERKREREAVAKLMGMKNWRVILIADEHSELSPAINEAAYGNLASNIHFQFIGIANPASYYDAFGEFTEPKSGWTSIHQESEEWQTKYGHCIRFDGTKSPNILLGEDKYPWMITHEKLKAYEERLGPNSASFWRMVRGFWCPVGTEGTVFTESEIVAYGGSKGVGIADDVAWAGAPTNFSCLDPSFTNGGDDTVAYFGRYGMTTGGKNILLLTEQHVLQEDLRMKDKPRSHQIVDQWKALCFEREVAPANAGYDATGGGIPFGDVVATVWSNKVRGIQFGGKATDRPMSENDDTPANKRCANRVTEIWHAGAAMLRNGQLRGVTNTLARGLCERRVVNSKRDGNIILQVESKREMKQRLGRSPDAEDAALMLVDMVRERGKSGKSKNRVTATTSDGSTFVDDPWARTVRRYDQVNWTNTLTPMD